MVESAGLAPASTACKAAALLLSYDPDLILDETLCALEWWSRRGSNPLPPVCQTGALPSELRPRMNVSCDRADE